MPRAAHTAPARPGHRAAAHNKFQCRACDAFPLALRGPQGLPHHLIPCSRSENDEWCRRGPQQRATSRRRNPPEIERPDKEIPLAESACDARPRNGERRSNTNSQSGNQSSLRVLRRSKSRKSFRPLRGKTASLAAFHKSRRSCTLLMSSQSLQAKEIRVREDPKHGKQRSGKSRLLLPAGGLWHGARIEKRDFLGDCFHGVLVAEFRINHQ